MPAVPIKTLVADDFLANHIGQLLIRQPPPIKDEATPRQRHACLAGSSSLRLSSSSRSWVAVEDISSASLSASHAGSGDTLRSSTSRGSADSTSSRLAWTSFSERDSICNLTSMGSELSTTSKDGGSEPDLSSHADIAIDARRHRRAGSEAILSPRLSFTTSFGAIQRKSRSLRPPQAVGEAMLVQLSCDGSVRGPLSSGNSNGSISPLDIYTQSPWGFPSSTGSPPLQSVDELVVQQRWSAVFDDKAMHQAAININLQAKGDRRHQPESIDPKDTVESPSTRTDEVSTHQKLDRAATMLALPSSHESGSAHCSTPISRCSPSFPGSQSSESMSRHGSAQRKKHSLVLQSSDGRTFRFVDGASKFESDAEAEVGVALHGTGDGVGPSGGPLKHGASSETLGPARASRALIAALDQTVETRTAVVPPSSMPPTLDASPTVAPIELKPQKKKRMTLLERTMAAERGSSSKMIEILGQKIERRGLQAPPSKPPPLSTHAAASDPPCHTPGGYGQGKRTFKLRPVRDCLTALNSAIPVVLPADQPKPAAPDDDRTSRWAREHSNAEPSSLETGERTAVKGSLASPPEIEAETGSTRFAPVREDATDYFASWSKQQSKHHWRRCSLRLPLGHGGRAGASYMTHTTSSTSSGTNVSNLLEMSEADAVSEHTTTTTPTSSPETPPSMVLSPVQEVARDAVAMKPA
ncbi:hypothetical protein ACQY0O_000162 [Thecaphora frezii]